MKPLSLSVTLLGLGLPASGLAAADLADLTLGNQPVAIGAGPRALGMGGAFSAVADDATACTWNPAGLVQLERPEAAASFGWYHADMRPESGDRESLDRVQPEHLSLALPFFAFGCQQTLGLAWQRKYDYTRKLSDSVSGVSGDDAVIIATDDDLRLERSGAMSTVGISYAIEVVPGLSFGATGNLWADRLTRSSHYREEGEAINRTSLTMTLFDITMSDVTTQHYTAESRVTSGSNLVLGGWWQTTPDLTLALVFKPGYTLAIETSGYVHQVMVDGDGNPLDEWARDTASDSLLHHPPSATIGAAWRHADSDTISADLTWTRWSHYYSETDGIRSSPVNSLIPVDEFHDLWTVRLGYEHIAILPRVVLVPRCGVLYEALPATTEAPALNQAQLVSATRDQWWGATVGLSICQRSVIWDLGAQVRYGHDVGTAQFANTTTSATMILTTVRAGVTVQF